MLKIPALGNKIHGIYLPRVLFVGAAVVKVALVIAAVVGAVVVVAAGINVAAMGAAVVVWEGPIMNIKNVD